MLELFGVIVVWLTVAVVVIGTLLMIIVSTVSPHFMQGKPKNTNLVKTGTQRAE